MSYSYLSLSNLKIRPLNWLLNNDLYDISKFGVKSYFNFSFNEVLFLTDSRYDSNPKQRYMIIDDLEISC